MMDSVGVIQMKRLTQLVVVALVLGIVGGVYATSKKGDMDVLAKVGHVVGVKAKGALPSSSHLAGPLTSVRLEGRLPLEERVQVRIRTDKRMEGTDVTVASGSVAGEVRLRGLVKEADQAQRAVKLAESTIGVSKVLDEIARPE
jgi:hypothetical protein